MRTGIAVGVVDDDRDSREALALLLEAEGFRVRQYPSAEAYLAGAGGDEACVVTDLHMPGRSGLDLLRELRAHGDATPVILMNGRPTPTLAQQALDLGMFAVLAKPLAAREIVQEVRAAVGLPGDDLAGEV